MFDFQIREPTVLKSGSRVIFGKNHVFRFSQPDQQSQQRNSYIEDNIVDWNFAQVELLEKQGVDLKGEMEKRLVILEEQFKKEKQVADQLFEKQRQVSDDFVD